MSPTKAYVQGWLTRAEYIAARMRIAERKLRFQQQIEEAQRADTAVQPVKRQPDTRIN